MMGDFKFALRQLQKAPAFTAAAVLTLALGIGANTAMFSVVDGVVLRSLPYEDAGQLVHVWEAPQPGGRNSVSGGVFSDWARHQSAFEDFAAMDNADLNLTGAGEPERITGLRMSPSGLRVFRARPLLGRTFAPDEDVPGKDKVVVLTHRLWQRSFGADPDALGRTVRLNGEGYTVIGVLPRGFLPWDRPEFVIPLVLRPGQVEQRSGHWLRVLGRLKPGVTVAQARENLLAASQPYRSLYPVWKKEWGATVVPMHEQLTGDVRPILFVLLGAVGLVLLIACANVANLLLARASARQKEIAVRLAIGASRARVIRQLLAESLVLALLGAAVGVGLAFAGTAAIRGAAAADLPRAHEIAVDWRVLAFAMLVSVATGVLFGLAPALQASRPDLGESLKEAGRGTTGARNRTRSTLIVSEVALALVLLVGAGLLVNSFVRLLNVPPGFEPRRALALQMSLGGRRFADSVARAAFTERVLERIQALPGVQAAGATLHMPLGWPFDNLIWLEGRQGPADGRYPCDFDHVSPGFFRAMGIPLLRGRVLDARDTAATTPVAVVNQTFVRTHYSNEDPLGKLIDEGRRQWEIVGVVGDVRMRGLAERPRPMMYKPLAFAEITGRTLIVRTTTTSPLALVETIRKAVLAVDPEQPIAGARSLEDVVSAAVGQRRLVLVVLALFACGALLLAAVGLYGVIAYTVSQRTREIGIRMAVGADRRDVRSLFLRQGLRLTGAGVAIGLLGSVAATRLLATQLYDVDPTDAATFTAVAAVLSLVALAASWLPARRAARVDPMQALR